MLPTSTKLTNIPGEYRSKGAQTIETFSCKGFHYFFNSLYLFFSDFPVAKYLTIVNIFFK